MEPLQLVGEPSQEGSDLAVIDASEPGGEMFAAYVLWTGPGTVIAQSCSWYAPLHCYLVSIASCNSSVGDAAP